MLNLLKQFHIRLQQFGRDVVDTRRQCIETICGFGISALMSRMVSDCFELHPEDSSVFDYVSHAHSFARVARRLRFARRRPGLDIVYHLVRQA